MPTSILDLLTKLPSPIPANAIPFWDGCDWTLITLPANGLNTCQDVQSCIDGTFIGNLLHSSDNSITINGDDFTINPIILQALINVQLNGTLLSVGGTTVDLNTAIQTAYFTITDGSLSTQINFSDVLTLVGADGLIFSVPFNDVIQIGLPTQRQHMQVLTWDAINNVAYRDNNQCCAQTLSFDTVTNILSISGTNAVDLTSINTDNQELAINGNILSITQLNSGPQAVDLTNVNEHTLGFVALTNILTIYGSDGVANGTVDLSQVDRHTLGVVGNLLSIYDSTNALVNFVDLSNVNEHTLAFDVATNMLSIIGSSGLPANNIVDLSLVNLHTLNLVGNLLEILNSDGTVNNTVNLATVDKHTLQIAGDRDDCPNNVPHNEVIITIHDSTGTQSGPAITIPRPAITCCEDVMACSGIQDIIADVVVLTNRVMAAENAIQLLQGQLP